MAVDPLTRITVNKLRILVEFVFLPIVLYVKPSEDTLKLIVCLLLLLSSSVFYCIATPFVSPIDIDCIGFSVYHIAMISKAVQDMIEAPTKSSP